MRISVLILLPIFCSSCASLSPKGEAVELTSDPAQVQGCKLVGKVKAKPPYGLPTDWKKKLRNQAGELGANRVFAESPGLQTTVDGDAYACPSAQKSN